MTSGRESGDHRMQSATEVAADAGALDAERLLDSLDDADWHVRQEAAIALIARGGNEAIDIVLRALRENHYNLGRLNAAIRVLAESRIDVVGRLMEFLDHPDPQLRMAAALTLGERGDSRAIASLVRSLDDADLNVRFHVIEALGKLHAVEAVDRLVVLAESRDFSLTAPALEALAAIGDGRIASRLTPLLDDELFQPAALDALGRLGGEEVLAQLVRLLGSADAAAGDVSRALLMLHDRLDAADGRGEIVAEQVAQAITPAGIEKLMAASYEKPGPRLEALVVVMSWIDDPEIIPILVRLLSLPAVRSKAVDALVRKGRQATDLLVEQLAGEDLETRRAAVIALGRIGDPRAVSPLVPLTGSTLDIATLSIEALGLIRDERAQEPLIGCLGSGDALVRQAAIAALCSLRHPSLENDLTRLLADANPLIRESAARIAGSGGFHGCGGLLLERCHDESESVRWAAFDALGSLDDPRVVPVLAEVLRSGKQESRAAGVRALARMDNSAARPLLALGLCDPDPWVRYFAARALGRQKDADSLAMLMRLAEFDDAMQVRVAAVDAIGQIGSPTARVLLARLADEGDTDLSHAAAVALGRAAQPNADQQTARFPSREEDR